jgi:dTDP-glucose 4,6-dehydratase
MSTLLITGGAGFIGSALVAQLAQRGDRVVVLDKLTYAGHKQNLDGVECELVEGDILDAELLKTVFAQRAFDAVIHAAAESHVDNSIAGSAAFIETNVVGTHRMLEAARHAKVKCFVHVSTDEVYGALGADGIFTTHSPMQPNSPYAASKAASDHLARSWFKTYGLPVVITRCCNNYGPRQHPEKLIPRMLTNAQKGEKLPVYGDGKQVREWIHVDDHARGIIAALERGTPGEVYHLGSGEERQNIELVELLCDLIGNNSRGLITHVADRPGHDFRYALDIGATERAIGFKPAIPFKDGIAQTVQWYRDHPQWVETMLAWRGR